MSSIEKKNIYGNLYRFYDRNLYPYFQNFRGATRISLELINRSLKSKGVHNSSLEIYNKNLVLSSPNHFLSLVDENKFSNRFIETVNEDDIVADLGACKGFYSCISALKANRVYGFEFSPKNIQDFRKNKVLNKLSNLQIIEKAVSNSEGYISAEFGKEGTNTIGQGNNKVETTTLDKFFENRDYPDIMKIDVEGAELKVLNKSKKLIKEKKPKIFLELHEKDNLNSFNHDPTEVLELLENEGYRIEFLSQRKDSKMFYCEADQEEI